jgi:hypothetical protein
MCRVANHGPVASSMHAMSSGTIAGSSDGAVIRRVGLIWPPSANCRSGQAGRDDRPSRSSSEKQAGDPHVEVTSCVTEHPARGCSCARPCIGLSSDNGPNAIDGAVDALTEYLVSNADNNLAATAAKHLPRPLYQVSDRAVSHAGFLRHYRGVSNDTSCGRPRMSALLPMPSRRFYQFNQCRGTLPDSGVRNLTPHSRAPAALGAPAPWKWQPSFCVVLSSQPSNSDPIRGARRTNLQP